MLRLKSFYYFTIALVFFGLLAAGMILLPRIGMEMDSNIVAQAVRYRDCYELINAAGKYTTDVEEYYNMEKDMLQKLHKRGINTIIVHDATLQSLARTGAIELKVDNGVVIAKETHSDIFDEVVEGARRRYGDKISVTGNAPSRELRFVGKTEPVNWQNPNLERAVQQMPLGIMTYELKKFDRMNFNIVVAPENFPGATEADVDRLFAREKAVGARVYGFMPVQGAVFGGRETAGYLADRLERQFVVLLERPNQLSFVPNEGQDDLARKHAYAVLRAGTIDCWEMTKLKPEDALRRWDLANAERGIRLNIIQPFLQGSDDLIQTNLDYVQQITDRVQKRGFEIGFAKPLDSYFPSRLLIIPVIAAVVAAAVLLCQVLLNWGTNLSLILWGLLTGAGVLGNFVYATVTHQAVALVAAIVFPVLTVLRITDMLEDLEDVKAWQIVANGVICLGLCVLLSLCGAVLLSAVMTDSRFLLELDFYRGVKVTFILPLILMLWAYVKQYDLFGLETYDNPYDKSLRKHQLAQRCLTWKNMLKLIFGLIVLCGVLYVFLGRTGHSWQIPIPQFELEMRYWLEEHLYARPREKEFLIGHVAFMLMVLAAHKQWGRGKRLFLAVVATIGQVSLIETFCHMRTPFLMSVVRGGYGYLFGAVLGGILVCLIVYLTGLVTKDGKQVGE